MQFNRDLMHLKDLQRHLVHLYHLDRNLNNMINFLLNVLSNPDVVIVLKISSLFLAISRSLEKIHLDKGIFSLALRNDFNRNLVYD